MQYSPSTGCFYPPEIKYAAIPQDAVDATPAQFAAAMSRGPLDTIEIVNGAVVVAPYAGPTLADAQAAQIAMLNAAFQAAIAGPVSYTTAGGSRATFPQSAQAKAYLAQCLGAGADAWTLNLWLDVNNAPISPITFADLQGLAAAMEAAEAPEYQDLLAKISAVQAATTVAAVQAITF